MEGDGLRYLSLFGTFVLCHRLGRLSRLKGASPWLDDEVCLEGIIAGPNRESALEAIAPGCTLGSAIDRDGSPRPNAHGDC